MFYRVQDSSRDKVERTFSICAFLFIKCIKSQLNMISFVLKFNEEMHRQLLTSKALHCSKQISCLSCPLDLDSCAKYYQTENIGHS